MNRSSFFLLGCILVLLSVFCCNKPFSSALGGKENCFSPRELIVIQSILDFENAIHPSKYTKGVYSQDRIASIELVTMKDTKSGLSGLDSVYIINFEEEEGFAVVYMDNGDPYVVVLTESGTLDSKHLFNRENTWESECEQMVIGMIESNLRRKPFYSSFTESNCRTKSCAEQYNVWYTDTIVHPIVHLKWGQAYPFNMSMPSVGGGVFDYYDSLYYNGKYAVGCVIIAAMQMMTATEHPFSLYPNGSSGTSYDLYLYSDVSDYSNYQLFDYVDYETYVSPYLKTKTEQLADLLHYFGIQIGASQNPNGSTGANSLIAMNYLSTLDYDRYGNLGLLECNQGFIGYRPVIYSMIDSGKPLMIRGECITDAGTSSADTSGHSWLIDGYLRRHMTRPDGDEYTSYYVHFNWGWRGKYDGYYSNCKISNRFQQDSVYDTNFLPVSSCEDNYNLNVRIFTY